MPMVYDLPTAGASPLPLQHFDAPEAKNFAAAQLTEQGQAVTKAGVVVTQIQQELQDDIDEATVRNRLNLFQEDTRKVMNGYLSKNGQDAVAEWPKVETDLKELTRKMGEGLNPVQQALWSKTSKAHLMSQLGTADGHYRNQAKAWNITEAKAGVDNRRTLAYDQADTWKAEGGLYAQEMWRFKGAISDLARKTGVSEGSEAYKDLETEEMTKLHEAVIRKMINQGFASQAKDYYNTYKDSIDIKRREHLDAFVRKENDEQTGINLAMGMSSRLGKEDLSALVEEGFKKLGGGTSALNADAFKVFKAQLSWGDGVAEKARKDNRERLELPVYQKIMDAEKSGQKLSPVQLGHMPEFLALRASSDPDAVKAAAVISDKVYNEFTSEARFNKSMAAGEKNAQKEATKEAQRLKWLELYADPDRVAHMSAVDVMKEAASLGGYGDDLLKMHKKATSPEALAELKVEANTFKAVMRELKIPTKDQPVVQEKLKAYLIREQQTEGRKLDADAIRKKISAAVTDVYVNERETLFGINMGTTKTKKKLFEVQVPGAVYIPAEDEKDIDRIITSNGLIDTPETRLRLYKAKLANRTSR